MIIILTAEQEQFMNNSPAPWLTEIGEKIDAADASIACGEGIPFDDVMNPIFDRFARAINNSE